MNRSPDKPWGTGKFPAYTSFHLQVNVCQDGNGNVWSDHDFASETDNAVAMTLPQGGIPQIAHALLTEAVRREIFMCALLELTKDDDFLDRYMESDAATKAVMETDLQQAATHVITNTLKKMTPGTVSEVLTMMTKS